jgi:hypothetical protein
VNHLLEIFDLNSTIPSVNQVYSYHERILLNDIFSL